MRHPTGDDCRRATIPVPVKVLALLALCYASLRIGLADSPRGDTASLSANDRSRWSTVASLVHHGSYVIDPIVLRANPKTGRKQKDKAWYSIDQVRHKGRDGREHYYSSKPPLLSTWMAGNYWLLNSVTGWDIRERPHLVIRSLLLLTNLPCFLVLICLSCLWAQRYCETGWARVFAAAVICWGTLLSTFANTFNNHLVAATCVALSMEAAFRIFLGSDNRRRWYLLAGGSAALAAACELPALAMLALLGPTLLAHSWRRTLTCFVCPVAIVAVAFFVTNWLAHQSFKPAYAHRHDGPVVAEFAATTEELDSGTIPDSWRGHIPADLSGRTIIDTHEIEGRWILWDPVGQDRFALQLADGHVTVHQWNNWYDYRGTHWVPSRSLGFDAGEPSRLAYAFHMLIGHHGVFSLTPIWLLSLWGACVLWTTGPEMQRRIVLALLLVSLVVIAFYVMRPLRDRNYGGNCCGLRWLFWLIPGWFYLILPALDRLAFQPGRRQLANLFLLFSVVTSVYAFANPWQPPWLYTLVKSIGLISGS